MRRALARSRPWSIRASAAAEESLALPSKIVSLHTVSRTKIPCWRPTLAGLRRARLARSDRQTFPLASGKNHEPAISVGWSLDAACVWPLRSAAIVFLSVVKSIISLAPLRFSPRKSSLSLMKVSASSMTITGRFVSISAKNPRRDVRRWQKAPNQLANDIKERRLATDFTDQEASSHAKRKSSENP